MEEKLRTIFAIFLTTALAVFAVILSRPQSERWVIIGHYQNRDTVRIIRFDTATGAISTKDVEIFYSPPPFVIPGGGEIHDPEISVFMPEISMSVLGGDR